MNIGMVLNTPFPPDIRVEKEARSLIRAGHKVYLLTSLLENRPQQEDIDGITVKRISSIEQIPFVKRKLISLKFYLTFIDEFWQKEIEEFVDTFNINVLHVHDLLMVGTSIKVAKKKCIPIIADLHENYPFALQIWRYSRNRNLKEKVIDKLFNNLSRWINYEKKWLQEVNHIIVVVDEAKKRIMKYEIPPEKITVLMNVEDLDYFNNVEYDVSILKNYKEQKAFIVSYIGGFAYHRGLDVAIKAITFIRKEISNIKLLLVGAKKNSYLETLKKCIQKLKAEDVVEIVSWQPFDKIATYIKISDVCLVPHHRNPHTDSTIPHKLFQYMLMGKPVIVSNCRPLKRIIEETQAGLVFQAGNACDLAHKIIFLYKNYNLRERYGIQGRRMVSQKYNWGKESEKLLLLYRKITN